MVFDPPQGKDNMTDLADELEKPDPQNNDSGDQQLSDNQVISPSGDVVDLGISFQTFIQR